MGDLPLFPLNSARNSLALPNAHFILAFRACALKIKCQVQCRLLSFMPITKFYANCRVLCQLPSVLLGIFETGNNTNTQQQQMTHTHTHTHTQ